MEGVSLNPFDESDNDDEKLDYLPDLHLCNEDSSDKCNSKSSKQVPDNLDKPAMTIDGIASRLINDRFLLTALEFHMELMESGYELPRFRDFFSNPANFERGRTVDNTKLTRTSSIQTFDSLDFARYSDDGERHESDRIAVLEFELRKAHEKINSLRSSLTKTAETDSLPINFDLATTESIVSDESFMPYERRALNFLINEYLLKYGYKLTSVTFSEESDGQDFDDWDDVGINISKPPNLLKLFRDYGHHTSPLTQMRDVGCMALIPVQEQQSSMTDSVLSSNEVQILHRKIEILEKKLEAKVKDNDELKISIDDLKTKIASNCFVNNSSEDNCPLKSEENSDVDNIQTLVEVKNETPQVGLEGSGNLTCFQSGLTHPTACLSSFQKKLFDMIKIKEEADKSFPHELLCSIPSCLSAIVEVLGDILPKIVPNILLAKRDELIPLLINAAALHPRPGKRDELLGIIFNLIKRPNIYQRQAIMTGCIAFAQHVGPLQTEAELLPQCWEQIFHKYPERRLLVAETCGCLSPYILEQTRSSLLFSMLDQMSTDKEEDVREAVAKSLSVVASFLETGDKYSQMVNLLGKLLIDPSEKVASTTKIMLLPAIAKWSLDLKCLESFLNQIVMEPIESSIYQTFNHYAVKDQKLFISNMKNLHNLLPFIVSYVITSCYNNKNPDDQLKDANNGFLDPRSCLPILEDESLGGILTIMSREDANTLIDHFYTTISQEWFASWKEYDWLTGELLQRLIDLSSKLEISQPSLHFLVSFFKDLCTMLSPSFSQVLMKSKFEKLIVVPSDENSLDRALMNGQSTLNRSIVPIFVAGVYPTILDDKVFCDNYEENHNAMFKFLCDLLRSLAIHQSTLISLQASFTELCSSDVQSSRFQSIDMILQVLWGFGIVHKNHLVRAATSQLTECLISTCNLPEVTVTGRIIPALVTLASDVEECVRISTISPLGAIMEYVSSALDQNNVNTKAIFEKVQVQLQAFMEEHQSPNELKYRPPGSPASSNYFNLEIIKVLGRIGPKVDAKFRDEFILPRLTALAVRNQLSLNTDLKSKQEVAIRLLDAFINISCCFLSRQVSQEVVLPGLKCLHHDIQTLAPDRVNIISSLVKEMEDKIDESGKASTTRTNHDHPNISQGINLQTSQPMEITKPNLLSRIKDVKDKATNAHFTKMFYASKR